jgi:hypothetical protein
LLGYGFARGLAVPNSEAGVANSVHPNAIVIFQVLADRNGDNAISPVASSLTPTAVTDLSGTTYYEASSVTGSPFNWYPINLYDAREGENWDVSGLGAGSCTANGVMNVVELDAGNLRKWLLAKSAPYTAGTGSNVDYVAQNGYILYFSDRRGMQLKAGNASLIGEYGFEDVINLANNGVPDGKLEAALPVPAGSGRTAQSPEDVNNNGVLDTYGVKGVGDAFGLAYGADTAANPPNPFKTRIASCYTIARKNRVTGARHVLKLVNGGMPNTAPLQSNLPTRPDNNAGGFTVGSENPVYLQGDYNSSSLDTAWSGTSEPNHAAAAVIADAVTLLSNNWQDAGAPKTGLAGSLWSTTSSTSQPASTTYYRVAVAAGKVMNFNDPTGTPDGYFGTDGGLHNFLRFSEDWGGQTLWYKGSLVSLYWSTYATGTFKCCNIVYNPPTRKYFFDPLFSSPAGLPPGTPMFRDIDNLSYRQSYTARTN